jgi:hypothetical protein
MNIKSSIRLETDPKGASHATGHNDKENERKLVKELPPTGINGQDFL